MLSRIFSFDLIYKNVKFTKTLLIICMIINYINDYIIYSNNASIFS